MGYHIIGADLTEVTFLDQGTTVVLEDIGDKLGVGTDTPTARLHVVGIGGETETAIFYHSAAIYGAGNPFLHLSYGGTSTLDVYSDGADDFVVKANNQDLHVDTIAGKDLLLQESGGDVGIGTTTPDATLEVVGSGGETDTVRLYHSAAVYNAGNPFLHMSYAAASTLSVYSDGGNDFVVKANQNDLHVDTVASKNLLLQESGGNVGIGFDAPTQALHVKSATSAEPVVLIENANADGLTGTMRFYKNTASPAVADQIGLFKFVGKDAAGDDAEMAFIVCKSESVTDSDFEGGLHFGVASAGANAVSTLSLIGQGTAKTTYAVFGDPWEGATNTKVGIGDAAPGTPLQITDTAPYVTLKNSTAENTAAGCESKILFEDHGDNALGQIEVSHVGTSDDEKGQLVISTNNDSGLQAAVTISEAQNVTVAGTVTTTAVYVNNGSGNDAALVLGDGTTNYWQVMYDAANADAAHRFIIYDSASPAVESPFVIEQGAPADSVYMDSTGVGIGTGAPATTLHVKGDLTVEAGSGTDRMIKFDGDAQDYRVGIDDGTDTLEIGNGTTMGASTALGITSAGQIGQHRYSANRAVHGGVGGGSAINSYSILTTDSMIFADDTSNNAKTLTFPVATAEMDGQVWYIKDIDNASTNNITLAVASGDYMENTENGTYVINSQRGGVMVVCRWVSNITDGKFYVVNKF